MLFLIILLLLVLGQDHTNPCLTVIDPIKQRAYTQEVGIFDGSRAGTIRHDPFTSISGFWVDVQPGVTVDVSNRYFRGADFYPSRYPTPSTVTCVTGCWLGAGLGLVAELVAYHPAAETGYCFTVTPDFVVDVSKLNISDEYRWFYRFYLPGDSEEPLAKPVKVPAATLRVDWLYQK